MTQNDRQLQLWDDDRALPGAGRRRADVVSPEWERRLAKIAVVVNLGVLVGLLANALPDGKSLNIIGFLIVGVAALLFLTRNFQAGCALLIAVCWIPVGSPPIAQGGSGGGDQRLYISHLGIATLLMIWMARLLFRPGEKADRTELFPALLSYFLISAWSTANSLFLPNQAVLASGVKQYAQVNVIEILTRVLAFGAILLAANALRGKWLKFAAVALLTPGVASLFGIERMMPGPVGWIGLPQILATALCAAFALDSGTPRAHRILAGVIALLLFGYLFLINTSWVSGWMGAFVSLALLTYHSQRKLFWGGVVAIALIVLANFPYFYENIYVANFYTTEGKLYAAGIKVEENTLDNDRLRMIKAATLYAWHFPLGIGCGNYRGYNGYFGRPDVWNTTEFTSAHGTYAQTLSETGWLGLITFMWIIIGSARLLKRYYGVLPPGRRKTFMLGAWGAVVGLFCASFNGDYLLPTYHNGGMGTFGVCVYTWLTIGIAIATAREAGIGVPAPKTAPKPVEGGTRQWD
jgi:hypothetical protein